MPRGRLSINKDGIGQALMRQKFGRTRGLEHARDARDLALEAEAKAPNTIQSIIDRNDLDELMSAAEMSERDFSALRGPVELILNDSSGPITLGLTDEDVRKRAETHEFQQQLIKTGLPIPRRPAWTKGTSPRQLDANERAAFLEWRRGLADIERRVTLPLTPFEKNLEIWRQLWRVLERSQLIVTVVDSRHPLFYACPDLEASIAELQPPRRSFLLLNKADLLPLSARQKWAAYFRSRGIDFAFWSAKAATEEEEEQLRLLSGGVPFSDLSPEGEEAEEEEEEEEGNDEEGESKEEEEEEGEQQEHRSVDDLCGSTRVLGRPELLELLESKARAAAEATTAAAAATTTDGSPSVVTVGFVGFPNVGKSSSVNALVGSKRTGVTSTPGKTKHFQTLLLTPTLTLCDCPGLVFPSLSSSRPEMVAAGVLPVDKMTDHRGPVQYVADRVGREQWERVYGVKLPPPAPTAPPGAPPTAAQVLRAYARSRGYVSSAGLPDETRASRLILKDFLSGKLLFYHLPPTPAGSSSGDSSGAEIGEEVRRANCTQQDNEEGDRATAAGQEYGGETEGRKDEVESGEESEEEDEESEGEDEVLEVDEELRALALGGVRRGAAAARGGAAAGGGGAGGGGAAAASANAKEVSHKKQHKKTARKKDRMWRVGRMGRDEEDGVPAGKKGGVTMVSAVKKDVSFGAANRAAVTPAQAAVLKG